VNHANPGRILRRDDDGVARLDDLPRCSVRGTA
jgi:hypothetical protein